MLQDWQMTARHLHQVAQIMEPIRTTLVGAMPNALHLTLEVTPDGLSTGRLPGGAELRFDYGKGALTTFEGGKQQRVFGIEEYNQRDLLADVLKNMRDGSLKTALKGIPDAELTERFLQNRYSGRADAGEVIAALLNPDTLRINAMTAAQYADLQYRVFTGLARFKARLRGPQTPLALWPHHFDLSTLWFANPDLDDHQAHLNFGFAPYSPGFDAPYYYAYAYPYPAQFDPPELPHPARWHKIDWTGVVVDYDSLVNQGDVAAFVEDISRKLYERLLALLS